METKHTKGEWSRVHSKTKNGIETHINGGLGNQDDICQISKYVGMDKDEVEANAKLIAAAPELLEALQIAKCILDEKIGSSTETYGDIDVSKINKAIKKATS